MDKSMNSFTDHNNPGISEASPKLKSYNYQIKKTAELKEINSFFYELEHIPTGAKHIHISNNDKENTFSVAFKTVPSDSTGVAHILEHTALCGSAKFPVRDPFFSMLKRSLSTFMNAFTASDWTMYPFSTQNKKDFYNLMDVYLDAAFFPRLDSLNFKQEGHRLEIEEDRLVYKGVVYNEMKGAMSSPDQVMIRSILNALYPSTTYGHNSGGEPAVIPTLTHEQLTDFHKTHYHPSNAFFYTYGDLPLEDHLSFIHDKILKGFEQIDPGTDVPSQPRWSQPKQMTYTYPLDKNEDPSKKCQVCVAWLAADIKDSFDVLALSLLGEIFLGNPASPLRKALIDSGLGTALSDGTGFDSDNRDTLFAFGLKGVEESAAPEIEKIIFDVLENLATNGIDKKLTESAIHQIEFHRKEITNTPYAYGIKLLLGISGGWFHGGDPVRILKFDDDLKKLNDELSKGPFFENCIKKYFLDNPHRVLFKLVPDQSKEQKENERVAAELEQVKSKMTPSKLDKIKEDTESLKQLQEAEEDLSGLPTLGLEDIPPSVQSVQEDTSHFSLLTSHFPLPSSHFSLYSQSTSGIFYFSGVSGTGILQKDIVPLAPFFCYAFPKVGTARRDYVEMAQMIDLYTGGIGMSSNVRTSYNDTGECLPFITFSGKCLVRNQGRMFEIIEELLYEVNFSDLVRLKKLLLEYRAGLESQVVNSGHRLAMSLSSRNFSATRALSEAWNGIHHLQTIKKITDELTDDNLKSLSDDLALIGKTILTENNLKIALIGEQETLAPAVEETGKLLAKSHSGQSGFIPPEINLGTEVPREGWSTSSAVSFVASSFETVRMDHEDSPALSVISRILRSMYLHREIREKGGAYGGFATYSTEDGVFSFGSYRDPHIVSTLNVYDNASAFIRSGNYNDEDIKEAILQVCSEIDRPDPPGPSAKKAFYRKIISLSDEARKRFKERLLEVTRKQVISTAEKYFDPDRPGNAVAVISGEDKLKEANEKMKDNPLALHRI